MFDLFEKWDGNRQASSSSASPAQSAPQQSPPAYDPYSSIYPGTGTTASNYRGKTFVLSVGGSVFFNEKLRVPEIAKFCETINELVKEGFEFVLVVGGGRIARVYQAGAKGLGANNFELDEMGIAVTKVNALLFTYNIDNAWKQVLSDPKDADNVLHLGKVPVFAGNMPGQTTDGVGAIIAEMLNCDFINLSNVDGIYSADPAKEASARMFTALSHVKMVSLLKAAASKPGAHTFIDPHAANILSRSKVRSFFINGNDLENFKLLLRGQQFRGTTVQTVSETTINGEDEPAEEE